jgi:hypothetical protein
MPSSSAISVSTSEPGIASPRATLPDTNHVHPSGLSPAVRRAAVATDCRITSDQAAASVNVGV